MMQQDLTSKERMLAALNIEEPDVVPIAPYVGYWYTSKVMGLQMSDWLLGDVETKVKIALHANRHHQYDWIMSGLNRPDDWKDNAVITDHGSFYEVQETHPETGKQSTRKIPKDEAPHSSTGDVTPENILEVFERECVSYDEILARGECHISQRLIEEVGDEVLVTGYLGIPFGEVGCRLGLQTTIINMFRNPDLIKEAIELASRRYVEEVKAQKEVGVEVVWAEEVYAGTDILSPEQFKEFSLPYCQKIVNEVRKLNMKCIFYFCGGVNHIIDDILTINADAFAFEEDKKGFHIDIKKIRELTKGKAGLFGNFDALYTLRSTPQEIENKVKEMILELAPGGGFILGTGSPILKNVPIENVETMIQTARRVGRYPILTKNI